MQPRQLAQIVRRVCWLAFATLATDALQAGAAPLVRLESGQLEGALSGDGKVTTFLGIPFAAPPVADLRWREPQPVAPWVGPRKALAFGARCAQARVFDDMIFRDEASEDCLFLNVWAPKDATRLPVMVWIHGGGFVAGSASEPRQDGEPLAGKGVVVVGINYRLGVFGFLAHPELTKESGRGASGNYGLLDQIAALRWVKQNIAAFGGDPANVTIFGESAGSFAVSALMVSPPAQGLFQRVIGESGAFFTVGEQTLAPPALAASESMGTQFGQSLGADSIKLLRAKSTEEILAAASGRGGPFRFRPNLDGYALTRDAYTVFAQGQQSRVPLLAGWNADEIRGAVTLAPQQPTPESFAAQVRARFGDSADALLAAYPAATTEQALESAAALGNDTFIGYATWKWIEMHAATGGAKVFRFSFDRKIPVPPNHTVNGRPATAADIGARHAGEIEYVFGTLASVPKVVFDPADTKLSELMMSYWTNFARTGDPNGPGLPAWPAYGSAGKHPVLHLDVVTRASPDTLRARYQALDAMTDQLRAKAAK